MIQLARPRRGTFLVPRVRIDTDDVDLAHAASRLLALILRRHTITSRALTTRDALEIPMHRSGVAVVGGSDAAAEVTPYEFTEAVRDEVVWLDLDLRDPDRATARVKSELPKGDVEDFSALGGGDVSDGIARAMQAWRAARGLEEHAPPITPFGREALLAAARALADAEKQPMIAHDVAAPEELGVFFLRAVAHARGLAMHDRVLALDPDDPWTLLERYVRIERPANPRDFAPLDRVLELAPLWPLPYGHRHGQAVDVDVDLDAASFCAWLDPGDDAAFSRLALALSRAHRYDEAVVAADRAARLMPWSAAHHRMLLAAATDRVRVGASLAEAERRFAFLRDLVEREGLNYTPDHRFVALIRSSALLAAGRFDEAVAARAEELGESAESWPQQNQILESWRTSPSVFARAYAREAYFRGDPGRALEGFAAARPETAVDAAAFVASFTALGQDDLATIAFAHVAETPQGRNAATRLAGARAMLARGELSGALEQLHNVSLRSPRRLHDARIVGVLRVASPVPAAAWEAVVRARLDVGALRLARMAARDAADFCPGLGDSAALRDALGEPSTRAFESAWLANVRAAVDTPHAAMIDALFHDDGDGVRSADVLVERWVEVARVGKPGEDAAEARIAYVLANALGRYLVATTRAPDAWSGGLRAVAIAALAGLEVRVKPARAVVRGLLEVLEAASVGVDAWLLDGYLLQLERALDLEHATLDKVAELADGLPRLGELLRGDLAIGRELAAARAFAAAGAPVQALPLLERSVRATLGDDLATTWAEVAVLAGTPREAIDAAWTALASNPFHAGPAITIAKAAFADGQPEIAYDVVTRHLGHGGKTWRDARVAELADAWAASGLDVPLDFDDAQEEGLGALQTGDGDRAVRCYAVCAARDPKNATVLKNVAMAEAARGHVEGCVAWFSRADLVAAPTWAAHQLMAGKKWPEALRASRFAERWYDDAQSFIYQANAAWFSGDDDEKLRAILRADAIDPTKVGATYLNGAAEVLGESGRYAETQAMANRLLAAAGDDATFRSLGEFELAVALLGQGRAKDALPHAERAVELNPLPDNAAELADVRDRCARGEPKPKVARKTDAIDARAFAALEAGDPKAVAEIARGAATGRLGRAALAAECHRFESEGATPVTKRRISAARAALTATRGSLDVHDSLAREAAMRALEDVYFATDPPPVLGVRPSRARLRELFPRR
jgi:tetratricopeptide (TPR) repeat protein